MTSQRNAGGDAAPKLLSGSNPQIPKGDGPGPVEAWIAAAPAWKGEVGRRIDDLVSRAVPDARRAVRWNTPFYGVEGRGWFLAMHCFAKYVKVTFLNGGQLDPMPPVSSKQEGVRYAHVGEHDELDEAQWRAWIAQAAALPGDEVF